MIEIERLPDWRERLYRYVMAVMNDPFRPGRHDCALFAAGAVEAMTGTDLAADWRGKYRSMAASRKLLAERGYDDHEAVCREMLPEVAPSFAQVGDIAVVEQDEGKALGIVQGEVIYCLHVGGSAIVPRERMVRAYRV